MQIVDLLAVFSDPETIESLSATQRLIAGLVTTLLGMGITFLALVVLMLVTSLMEKVGGAAQPAANQPRPTPAPAAQPEAGRRQEQDAEVAAAITSALAVMLDTSPSGIVVRNIRRVEDSSTSWSRAGLAEQLQNKI